jgi:hypothetical protein
MEAAQADELKFKMSLVAKTALAWQVFSGTMVA